ncbi:30S ribosomal protein S24e [Halopiger thermotolerans]
MDVDIVSEEDNPMLHRTDVTFELTHDDATPERLQVRDSLAAKLNKNADEVVIRNLNTKFGMRKTVGEAKVYESADFAREVEQDHMLERNKIGVEEEADVEAEEA